MARGRYGRNQAQDDDRAFPVRVRVLVPPHGFGRDMSPMYDWLNVELGKGEYAVWSSSGILGDAMAIHFRSVDDAYGFLRKFPGLVLADGTMSKSYSSPALPFGRELEEGSVCNLYSSLTTQEAMRGLFARYRFDDRIGNLPELPEIYPDQLAPIIRTEGDGLVLQMARWGMPTPPQYLVGKKTDRGVTNIRNARSPHWRRWLGPEHRCLVPVTQFAEPAGQGQGNVWFEITGVEQAFFAGIWTPAWNSVRKLKDGETTDDLYAFLTTKPNAVVGPIHPKAMPIVLVDESEWDAWLHAPWVDAKAMQRPLADKYVASI